jgi:hypothetical protein
MNRLTEKNFSFKCPMNWDAMQPSENGRFCSQCQKEVIDLTNCSLDEVRALQQKHGSICGSVRVAQVAVVALSLSAAACKEKKPDMVGKIAAPPSAPSQVEHPPAQGGAPVIKGEVYIPPPPTPPKEVSPPTDRPILMGKICPMPPAVPEKTPKE